MGFSSIEAIIILFVSYFFHFSILVNGIDISNIYLFFYNNWIVRINIGGAIIPILISLYLVSKKKLSISGVTVGIFIVILTTYAVTYPDPRSGIVSPFPYWLLPAIFASLYSIISYWGDRIKSPPLAYVSGTIGVLIGADIAHLPQLLSYRPQHPINAVIGGANVFDMIFITGLIAVFIDGILLFKKKRGGTNNRSYE